MMKRILAITLALLMLLTLGTSAAEEKRTATAVKAGSIALDGKMTTGEGWENADWIELTCKTNTTDTVRVKLLYDRDYLYFFTEVKNALWAGRPNIEDPFDETGWRAKLSASPESGDTFGFSILVDEENLGDPRSMWANIDGSLPQGYKLSAVSTTWCNRYKYTWYQNNSDNADHNLGNKCSLSEMADHDPDTCPYCLACPGGVKVLRASGFSDDVIAQASGDKVVYVFRLDTQGGAGRYADANGNEQEFRMENGSVGINGIDEMRPMALTVDAEDSTVHRIEGRIHWVTSADSDAVTSQNVSKVGPGRSMGLEMKFGCGNDAWYFNCDPDGTYRAEDSVGVGFQIYKADSQWGKLVFSEYPASDDPIDAPDAPPTADYTVLVCLIAIVSAVFMYRKKESTEKRF